MHFIIIIFTLSLKLYNPNAIIIFFITSKTKQLQSKKERQISPIKNMTRKHIRQPTKWLDTKRNLNTDNEHFSIEKVTKNV